MSVGHPEAGDGPIRVSSVCSVSSQGERTEHTEQPTKDIIGHQQLSHRYIRLPDGASESSFVTSSNNNNTALHSSTLKHPLTAYDLRDLPPLTFFVCTPLVYVPLLC